jgi:hypothetical protein
MHGRGHLFALCSYTSGMERPSTKYTWWDGYILNCVINWRSVNNKSEATTHIWRDKKTMERISEDRCPMLAWNDKLRGWKERRKLVSDNGKGTLKLCRHCNVPSTGHLRWHLNGYMFWLERLLLFAIMQLWQSSLISSFSFSLART